MTIEEIYKLEVGDRVIDPKKLVPISSDGVDYPRIFMVYPGHYRKGVLLEQEFPDGKHSGTMYDVTHGLSKDVLTSAKLELIDQLELITIETHPEYYI